ncbi:MAG: cysteine-rich small domain-containing protein [Proteobacteria bacterium]|nr:cysteine-rich small domain-containing protein [Pseudomonadota bacterium]
MTKSDHRYIRNADCQYFPCHKVADDSFFNCLFCFCPLYWLENCGGNPGYREGIKDCTGCTLPHKPGGYEHVIERLKQEIGQRRAKHHQEGAKGDASPGAPMDEG